MLADEPTSALDPAATTVVCDALLAAVADPAHRLIVVVHDLELLPRLATRVIGMADGQVVWDRPIGQPSPPMLQALYARPAGPAAAAQLTLPPANSGRRHSTRASRAVVARRQG